MKKVKRFLAMFAAFAMVLTSIASLVACANPDNGKKEETHKCGHVCEVCHKCTSDCEDKVCEDKCLGHGSEEKHECGDKCPEPECGKCTTDCEEPECAEKCPGHGSEEHECESVCDICGKCENDECEEDECAEKCQGHFTITLNAGEGNLPEGAKTSYITNEGLLMLEAEEYLPVATISTAHWHFMGWYDAETDGNEVIEDETVFTEDTTIYARYGRDSGVWSGEDANEFKIALVRNNGATGVIAEYWFGGSSTKISVTEGERLTLYLDGKQIAHYAGGAVGVEGNKADSQKSDYVTVTVSGELNLYLKLYSHATDPNNYVCQWLGAEKVDSGSEIPEGCDAIKVTFNNGTVTLYLMIETATNEYAPIGKDDFSKYCLYCYNGEVFGNWNTSATKGVLQEEMTVSGNIPEGWIVRTVSGSWQTADIKVFKAGGTYLVKMPKAKQGTHIITEITPAE